MKSIKKITNKVTNNISGLAGSALLVGATLTGGAAFAAAQDSGSSGSSMDLGEYPQPFVSDDGEVQTSIVLGSDAQVTDVVGATEIAGSLGNAAFGEESIATSGGNFGWTADNGVTLDTRNDQLYFGDSIQSVRNTLTQNDLNILSETTFRDDSGTTYDVTNYLNVGDQDIRFTAPDSDMDPILNVNVPAENSVSSGASNYLYSLQANMDSINFTDEDVRGEEIELFGRDYTVADDQSQVDSDEIRLFGSSQEVDVQTGDSTTVTVSGSEVTVETVSVNSGGNNGDAAVRIDGDLRSVAPGDTINVDGEDIRVDEIIKTGGSQNSDGYVVFQVGSEEVVLSHNDNVQDADGDDIEGTHVMINGENGYNQGEEVSSIEVFVGSPDDDENYLEAGETFTHDLFENLEIQFGGLNPDTTSADSDSVSAVEFGTDGDDTATVDFTDNNGDSATIEFFHDSDLEDNDNTNADLEDSDQDDIEVHEGATIEEDEYFVSDAGDFTHMWEVTNIDRDASGNSASITAGDEATIDLQDTVTGQSVEVDLDAVDPNNDAGSFSGDDQYYAGTEIIDGQTYRFVLEGEDSNGDGTSFSGDDPAGAPEFKVAWDSSSSLNTGNAINSQAITEGTVSLYPAVDAESGAAVAFTKSVGTSTDPVQPADVGSGSQFDIELPSTESSSSQTVTIDTNVGTVSDVVTGTNVQSVDEDGTTVEAVVGQTVYQFETSSPSSNAAILETVSISDSQDAADATNDSPLTPASSVFLPEDENDEEHVYHVAPSDDGTSDDEVEVAGEDAGQVIYSGQGSVSSSRATQAGLGSGAEISQQQMDDDDNVYAAYDTFGTYSELNDDGQGTFTLHTPDGQATAGAAVTENGGSLNMGGGSGSVMAASPTYQYADGVLADDGNVGQVKNNDNVILVGGPAANSLTQELVDDNQTMPADDYTSGQGMIQMVDGFSEGNSALVVAGATGEDTRAAAEFLADYRNNADSLEGQSEVTIETQSGTVVE